MPQELEEEQQAEPLHPLLPNRPGAALPALISYTERPLKLVFIKGVQLL